MPQHSGVTPVCAQVPCHGLHEDFIYFVATSRPEFDVLRVSSRDLGSLFVVLTVFFVIVIASRGFGEFDDPTVS